jgi:hypothetical protein
VTKAAKSKAPLRKTPLDRIVAQLRAMLRRQTTDVVLAGNLLIESRKHLAHGEWQPWLAENFDLSYRTALNYVDAAEYVAQKCNAVAHFSNLAPSVLYALAAGEYSEEQETAILAASRKARIDQTRAGAICNALKPPAPAIPAERSAAERSDTVSEDDEDVEKILDSPPPEVPPPMSR